MFRRLFDLIGELFNLKVLLFLWKTVPAKPGLRKQPTHLDLRDNILEARLTPAVVLSESFDNFPNGNGWQRGDANPAGVAAYWGAVNADFGGEGTHSGSMKGYAAAVGYSGTTTAPTYRDSMTSFMQRSINLSGQSSASLSFWYKAPSIETSYDFLRVKMGSMEIFRTDRVQAGWTRVTVGLNSWLGGSHVLRFEFSTDISVTREGPYLDTIEVTATPAGDSFESDDTWQQATWLTLANFDQSGGIQTHSLHTPTDEDWAKFNLSAPTNLLLETRGTLDRDTVMTLYRLNSSTNQLEQIAFSDDEGNGRYSQILRTGANLLSSGTYYVKVAAKNQASTISSYTLRATVTPNLGSSAYRSDNWYWNNGRAPDSVECANNEGAIGDALGNCTWFVVGRARELGATLPQLTRFDQAFANHFDDRARTEAARNAGITVSAVPSVGAIAQRDGTFNSDGTQNSGHVAVVERLNRDASGAIVSVVVSQSSFCGQLTPSVGNVSDYLYGIETVPVDRFEDYISFANMTPTAPAAPSNLSASAPSSTQVTITWQDNSNNEQGFRIYRSTGSSWMPLGTVLADVRTFTEANLQPSTVYYYQVASYNNSGETWAANHVMVTTQAGAPANDHFENRRPLGTGPGRATGSNRNATRQSGEPTHAAAGERSVWFTWYADRSGWVEINTIGSTFDTTLAVYRGANLSTLTKVDENDDATGLGTQSKVRFWANSGEVFQIALDGWSSAVGDYVLNILYS